MKWVRKDHHASDGRRVYLEGSTGAYYDLPAAVVTTGGIRFVGQWPYLTGPEFQELLSLITEVQFEFSKEEAEDALRIDRSGNDGT